MVRAVFLDRDGTINKDPGYFHEPDKFLFERNAVEGLKRLSSMGYLLIVVQNQSGIGRGMFTEKDTRAVNSRISSELSALGVKIEGFYYCPHTPEEKCSCRKPLPGLILKAAEDFGVELDGSWMAGDKSTDVNAAENVRKAGHRGFRSIGLLTGCALGDGKSSPDMVAVDLLEAAEKLRKLG